MDSKPCPVRGSNDLVALVRPMFAIEPTWYLRLPVELLVVARRDG